MPKRCRWPGQFIGLSAISRPSTSSDEHVLVVLAPVPGGLPQLGVEDLRRLHLACSRARAPSRRETAPACSTASCPAGSQKAAPGEISENVNSPSSRPSLRWSRARACSRRSRCSRELGLGEERRAVDAREHRAVGVPAPVGAGDGLQLEGADRLRARGVRAAAEVGEGAVGVERDGLQRDRRPALAVAGRGGAHEIVDQLDLVVLALGDEALARLRDGHVHAHEALVRLHVGAHALLDRREVGLGDADPVGELEVVVEARPRSAVRSRSSRRGRGPSRPPRARVRRRGESARGPSARFYW